MVVVERALVGVREEIAARTLQAAGVEAFVRFVEDVVGAATVTGWEAFARSQTPGTCASRCSPRDRCL